jgi:trans-aconitate 2-methyltransferase
MPKRGGLSRLQRWEFGGAMTKQRLERPVAVNWNPNLCMKFETQRTRAARDLLAQVSGDLIETVYDLGCGPGNSVELLRRRFPIANIVGIDSSEAMLRYARRRAPSETFQLQDIETWLPDCPADLVFANAALHFLPGHDVLFPRLAGF